MGRPALEVADIFRAHGPAWREAQRGHLSLGQLKVMSAIEQCRSAALGGHVLRCEGCGADQIAYNSCRNRHCPKCQSSAAQRWLEARQADLLPVEYYHVVFTLPAPIADIAYQNKAAIYGLLFDVAAETLLTIAADPKHLGARIGATLVLHTWGSALTHHPHVHGIVPGGGLAPDGKRWVACRPGFFLPVRVLSRLFRRRFLEELQRLHQRRQAAVLRRARGAGRRPGVRAVARAAAPVRVGGLRQAAVRRARRRCWPTCRATRTAWRSPTAGCSRMDERGVTFRWKDYRAKGKTRYKAMTLEPRASSCAASCCTCCPAASTASATTGCWPTAAARPAWRWRASCCGQTSATRLDTEDADSNIVGDRPCFVCAHCGAAMIILQTFMRGQSIRAPPGRPSVP